MTIKDILRILLPKIKFIVIFPVVFVIAITTYMSLTEPPTYTATTQVMLLKVGEFITPESIEKAEKLMDTYVKLAGNPDVKLKTDEDMAKLFADENEENPKAPGYRVSLVANHEEYTLYVTATSKNPAVSSNAANIYATNVMEFLRSTMQSEDSTIIVSATPPASPGGNRMSVVSLIAGVLGLAVGAGIVLVLNSMDETIRTAEDLAECIDVMVLAEIPEIPREKKNTIKIRQKKYEDGRVSSTREDKE